MKWKVKEMFQVLNKCDEQFNLVEVDLKIQTNNIFGRKKWLHFKNSAI